MKPGTLTALVIAIGAVEPAQAADDGFAAFWSKFAVAVAKDDKAALASMTTLGPGLDDNDTPLTFGRVHALLLQPAARKCLAKGKPQSEVDGAGAVTYAVVCGQVIYVFSKTGAVWRWTDSSPDD
ncbi:MAG TPA: hypothetical protein VN805_02445 [Caulobacteraceae bacterium]|nr:hypothetical protein [Caulobacteraceae bacterium]